MAFKKHALCFRLLAPLHIGGRQAGNLRQTRGYVPGKVLWAGLTARLTRDSGNGARGGEYLETGKAVNKHFRFSYLYPAIPLDPSKAVVSPDDLETFYPWESHRHFDYRFLDCHAGTALDYSRRTAAEGQLREVEFIRPWTRPLNGEDGPSPVYLKGDLYVQDDLDASLAQWPVALARIQMGGERGYGWGRVRLAWAPKEGPSEDPVVRVSEDAPILAHVRVDAAPVDVSGAVEPLVGWARDNRVNRSTRWRLSKAVICYAPGAIVQSTRLFRIGENGLWL